MIYEIGWSSYDIIYVVALLCFIPLLILFVLLQKRYNIKNEGEEIPYEHEKARVVNVTGSKSTTKFMISALLVVFMIVSLSSIVTLINKHNAITKYKNGEYDVFTGVVDITSLRGQYSSIGFRGETTSIRVYESGREVVDFVEKNMKSGEKYTIYYTYSISEKTGEYIPQDILRIDKVQ
ncbi:MAG: hypothetical protein IJX57_06350 [Clostridia bacterium]|nr:hypothetical protein [Clostridia bacterium]